MKRIIIGFILICSLVCCGKNTSNTITTNNPSTIITEVKKKYEEKVKASLMIKINNLIIEKKLYGLWDVLLTYMKSLELKIDDIIVTVTWGVGLDMNYFEFKQGIKYTKGPLVNIVGLMIIVKSIDLNSGWNLLKMI